MQKTPRKVFRCFKGFPDLPYKTIVDLGACDGEFTDAVLAVMSPKRVVLIEADPMLVETLCKKYADKKNCSIVHAAVTDHCALTPFQVNNYRGASSLLPINSTAETTFGKKVAKVEEIEVQAISLDALFASEGLTEVDLLKVDIQGAEHLMIAGGKQALSQVKALYIEVCFERFYDGSKTFEELDHLLKEEGFKLRSFSEPMLGPDACLAYCNALYLRI